MLEYDITLPTSSQLYTSDTVIAAMLDDLGSMKWKQERIDMAKQIEKIAAFVTADPKLMFKPEYAKNPGEDNSSYHRRPKFARTLVSQVLDHRLAGVSSLPWTASASNVESFDFTPHSKYLNLQKIQTITEIGGTCAARPIYDDITGEIYYRYYPAHQFYPYLGLGENLLGISLFYKDGSDSIVELWSEQTFQVFTNGKLTSAGTNPYGEVPHSIFKLREHPLSWWGVSDLGAVTQANIAINKAWSDLLELAREQSFSIYVITSDDDGPSDQYSSEDQTRTDIQFKSGKAIIVPKGSKIETLSPDADINAISNVITQMSSAALRDGYVIDVDPSSVAESGFALTVKRQPYLNKMGNLRKVFKRGHQQLLEKAEIVRYVGQNRIESFIRNPDFTVRVDYDASSLTPKPQNEVIDLAKFELDLGIISPVDYLMRTREITREEAETIIMRVKEENERLNTQAIDLNNLTLGAERVARVKDIAAYNALRNKALSEAGTPAQPDLDEFPEETNNTDSTAV